VPFRRGKCVGVSHVRVLRAALDKELSQSPSPQERHLPIEIKLAEAACDWLPKEI
jgi:hypothetical protein